MWENSNFHLLQLIALGNHSFRNADGVYVCAMFIKADRNGQITENPVNINVRRVLGHPNRRAIEWDVTNQ